MENKPGGTSWGIIILLLILFWPVGLYFLYKKVTGNKADALKNSKLLHNIGCVFVVFAFIYLLMILTGNATTEDDSSTAGSLYVAIAFFGGGGVFMIYTAKKIKANAEKSKKYIAIVVNNNKTAIDNIAAAIPTSYEQAVKDLQKMIDKGYFLNAYIDIAQREIVMPERRNTQLTEPQLYSQINVVDQPEMKVVICKNCGGNNKIVDGTVCECEFCGSLLK